MCSTEESVLSDVHMNVPYHDKTKIKDCIFLQQRLLDLKVVQTRFVFRSLENPDTRTEGNFPHPVQPTSVLPAKTGNKTLQDAVYDKDGDLILTELKYVKDVIIIDHCMETPLPLVGLQVWQGALLLADYFLHVGNDVLKNGRLIELGAGTGLCSLVAAIYAETVILTDYDEDVLELCQRNINQNRHLFTATTQVRKLDWCKDIKCQTSNDTRWKLELKDLENSNLNTVIAADVIYREDLTDALFKTVDRLMEGSVNIFYLALEKRLNFTLEDLDVACPAYNHFLACISKHKYNSKKLEINFPQYLEYSRTPQLELWVLTKES